MIKDSTQPILLQKLFELLEVHRGAFGQERIYWRALGMVLGEIFNFGRHTVTQGLMVLGITDGDWSSWYRLFSQRRYKEETVAKIFFAGNRAAYCVPRTICGGSRWSTNSPQQFTNAGDELAESTPHTGLQSRHSSSTTIYAWCLANTDGSRLQPSDPITFSARFSAQSQTSRGCQPDRGGSRFVFSALDTPGPG